MVLNGYRNPSSGFEQFLLTLGRHIDQTLPKNVQHTFQRCSYGKTSSAFPSGIGKASKISLPHQKNKRLQNKLLQDDLKGSKEGIQKGVPLTKPECRGVGSAHSAAHSRSQEPSR